MKSYLSLIPISARVKRKQNFMTILCISISVLLVTTIFSVSDMLMRTYTEGLQQKHGNWHIKLEQISTEDAREISRRLDVLNLGVLENFNTDASEGYYIGEKKAALYGTDNTYMAKLANAVYQGRFPEKDSEVMLSPNAKPALHVEIGDTVTLRTPKTTEEFTISGFGCDDQDSYGAQTYLMGVYLTQTAFSAIMDQNGNSVSPTYYVQFQTAAKASKAETQIRAQFHLSQQYISENTVVMGLAGKSNNASVKNIYGVAIILFVLVLLAGVLMISGSMNSNVASRTKFFGMMRCIGASRKQIIRYVRLEALNWCKRAIPVGLFAGILISWIICAVLHYVVGGEFSTISVIAFSPIGVISGGAVGIVTVLLAAQSPAKRASKVSPVMAVSGNAETAYFSGHSVKLSFGKVERNLGIHHGIASKKNWFLMTASFSFSIILFLCFCVGLNFMEELIPSMRPWQPDITLNGYGNALVLSENLRNTIQSISGVKGVYGCAYLDNVPATSSREKVDHVNLMAYSDYLLDMGKDSIVQGDLSEIYGDSDKVMTVINKDNPFKVGDTVKIAGKEVTITCGISSGLYGSDFSIICSKETFLRLTGKNNYSLMGIQLEKNATNETLQQINNLVDKDVIFEDLRVKNQQDRTTYLAFVVVVYSFLGIIAMITLFNIVNSISMSVTARMKQYGAMRAVGMDRKQLKKMIGAEAFTYAISGLIVGGSVGLVLHRLLYARLLTRYFGVQWELPFMLLGIILVFDLGAALLAVYMPAKKISTMSVTEIISEL